jgi:hypothetical protein
MIWENVALMTLKSAGCRNIAVLGDARMISQSSEDIGVPIHAGQSYHLAKRHLSSGCFHPKIVAQFGTDTGRLMIGSANLTSSGMLGNLEAISSLNYSADAPETAPVFLAALAYLAGHSNPQDKGMKLFLKQLYRLTPWLKNAEAADVIDTVDSGRVGILSDKPDDAIASQFVREIGVASIDRMIVVSAFWDKDLRGLEALRSQLGHPDTILIPDLSEQDFTSDIVEKLKGVTVCSPHEIGGSKDRRLHAKVILCYGKDANYVLTGSMNASFAGLWGRPDPKNVGTGNAEAAIFKKIPHGTQPDDLFDKLEKCISTSFPTEAYCERETRSAEGGSADPVARDGGTIEIENGRVIWSPVDTKQDADKIILFDETNEEIITFRAHADIGQKIEPHIVQRVCYGRIQYKDATLSTPVVVASLDLLARASEPPHAQKTERLIAELASAQGFVEVFMLIARLDALQHEEMLAKRPRQATRSTKQKEEVTRQHDAVLSEDEFYNFMPLEGPDGKAAQFATLSELRRAINRLTGHLHDQYDNPEDALFAKDTDVKSDEESKADDDRHGTSDGSRQNGNPPPAPPQPANNPAPMSTSAREQALHFIDDLQDRATDLSTLVASRPPGELPIDVCLVFQLITGTVLSVASKGAATTSHPLPAFDQEACWIRILAKILTPCCTAWSHPAMFQQELEPYQLEALAALFAALQILDTAIRSHGAIPPPISTKFQEAAKQMVNRLALFKDISPELSDRLNTMRNTILSNEHSKRLLLSTQ